MKQPLQATPEVICDDSCSGEYIEIVPLDTMSFVDYTTTESVDPVAEVEQEDLLHLKVTGDDSCSVEFIEIVPLDTMSSVDYTTTESVDPVAEVKQEDLLHLKVEPTGESDKVSANNISAVSL